MAKTHYDVLGVSATASTEEIRRAYLRLSLKLHPDKAGNTATANTAFIELKNAYETVFDPKRREEYDLSLLRKQRPSASASSSERGRPFEQARSSDGGSYGFRENWDESPSTGSHWSSWDDSDPWGGDSKFEKARFSGERSVPKSSAPNDPRPAPSGTSNRTSEFKKHHPTCPIEDYPSHRAKFASGGQKYCLCHQCEKRVLEDVYKRTGELPAVIAEITFVNRHTYEITKAAQGLFSLEMRQQLVVLERTMQAQLSFLEAWVRRVQAWVACPSCTKRVLSHLVLVEVEKMCRLVEYWQRHAPTLARLTRQAIREPVLRSPWAWRVEFEEALDKCRRDKI